MAPEAQLAWEARAGRLVAIAAFLAAILPLAGGLVGSVDRPDLGDADTAEFLLGLDKHAGEALTGALIGALGILCLIPVLYYLYRAAKFRRPETPAVGAILAAAGPLVFALATVGLVLDRTRIAHDFVDTLPLSDIDNRAEDYLDDHTSRVLLGLGLAGQLAIALAFVMVGLYAMRAGLMSRFMGTVGIILGVLYVIPLLGGPTVIQLFWMSAMGFLLLGRWPGGRGPAWETGTDESWPSAYDQREALERAEMEREGAARGDTNGSADLDADEEEEHEAHPVSKKRKRKRRR